MKIRPVAAELFHADGQTDMTKLIVVFRKFYESTEEPGIFIGRMCNSIIVVREVTT